MKCIKYYRPHGGDITRVTDEDAAVEVAAKRATYCPKHLYKATMLKEAAMRHTEEARG